MIAGTTLNAMVVPIQTLLLAANKVRFILYSNIIAFIMAIPVIVLLTTKFGINGGAVSVLVLFAGYFLIQAPMIFHTLRMKNGLLSWYLKDIFFFAAPLVILSVMLAQFNKYIITTNRWQLFVNLASITIFFYGVVLLMNKRLQELIGNFFKKVKGNTTSKAFIK
jgi:O-antigen/teichoic acid export membrane protein